MNWNGTILIFDSVSVYFDVWLSMIGWNEWASIKKTLLGNGIPFHTINFSFFFFFKNIWSFTVAIVMNKKTNLPVHFHLHYYIHFAIHTTPWTKMLGPCMAIESSGYDETFQISLPLRIPFPCRAPRTSCKIWNRYLVLFCRRSHDQTLRKGSQVAFSVSTNMCVLDRFHCINSVDIIICAEVQIHNPSSWSLRT